MRKTILIIEDDPDIWSYYAFVLRPLDVVMVRAANGREALDILDARNDIDLILLDLVMPVMAGEEFFRVLRQERGSSLPVVVCSTDGTRAERIRSLGSVQGVVSKGCRKEDLLRAIGSAVAPAPMGT